LAAAFGRLEINEHFRQLEILFARLGGKQRIELLDVALQRRFVRALQPDEYQRIRSQQVELVRIGDRLVVDSIQRREQARAQLCIRRRTRPSPGVCHRVRSRALGQAMAAMDFRVSVSLKAFSRHAAGSCHSKATRAA
jgi:hypothetical protein